MDEYTNFLIDACTIAGLIVVSLYNLKIPKRQASGPRTDLTFYLATYPLGLAVYIFFRSTIQVVSMGNVLPAVYLDFFWYDNLMLPGATAGAVLMIFSSFKIVGKVLNFGRIQKSISRLCGVVIPLLLFGWSLQALWIGQSWYNGNYLVVNFSYLSCVAALCGLAIHAMVRNKYQRSLSRHFVVGTLLAVLLFISLAQTICFFFNTIVLGFSCLWLTVLVANLRLSVDFAGGDGSLNGEADNPALNWSVETLATLNPSQRKVAELLLVGLEYKEIADQMGLSISAVKRRIHAIYQKFSVENRTEFFLACKAFH